MVKRIAIAVVILFLLVAFTRPYWKLESISASTKVPAFKLTDEQKFQVLDREAKKHKLRYKIFCTSVFTDEAEEYMGVAEHIEAPLGATYVDEGRMDEWMEMGFKTPADAAYWLSQAIQGAPTHEATKYFVRQEDHRTERKQCPRIQGNWQYQPTNSKRDGG